VTARPPLAEPHVRFLHPMQMSLRPTTRTGNGNALFLTTRQHNTTLPDKTVIPFGQGRQKRVCSGGLSGLNHLCIRGIRASKTDILHRRCCKDNRVLRHISNVLSEVFSQNTCNVRPINGYAPFIWIKEAQQHSAATLGRAGYRNVSPSNATAPFTGAGKVPAFSAS